MSSTHWVMPPPVQLPVSGTHWRREPPEIDITGCAEQVAPVGQAWPAPQSAMQKLSDAVPSRTQRLPWPHCASAMQAPQYGTVWPPPAVTTNENVPACVV